MATSLKDLLYSLQRSYFINRKDICKIFGKLIQTPSSLRFYHILVIFGPGGIGKTVLLGEFINLCGEHNIAYSSASLDMCHSPFDILFTFRENWGACSPNKPFREFDALVKQFKDIEKRLQKQEASSKKVSEVLGKVVEDVSVAAIGSIVSSLTLSPVGILISAAGGTLAKEVLESSTATLLKNGLISSNDADFLTNFLPNLISAFLKGTNQLAQSNSTVVLMLDAYEYAQKAAHLNAWITDTLLPNLTDQIFLVIAGRNRAEGKFWQTYSSMIYQRQLDPFGKTDLTDYLKVRGLAEDQTETLWDLTAGLPLVDCLR